MSYCMQVESLSSQPLDYGDTYGNWNKKATTMSADHLPDKSRNFSSYIMECGSSEKFELLLEKFQLILRRKFFRNICCNIFMKQLGKIRGKRNIPPAFTTVYGRGYSWDKAGWSQYDYSGVTSHLSPILENERTRPYFSFTAEMWFIFDREI